MNNYSNNLAPTQEQGPPYPGNSRHHEQRHPVAEAVLSADKNNGKLKREPDLSGFQHTTTSVFDDQSTLQQPPSLAEAGKRTDNHDESIASEDVTVSIAVLDKLDEMAKRLETAMFNTEAALGAAQHYVLSMPYRKLPMAVRFDRSTFDPNPANSFDPVEVSNILAALSKETGGELRAVYNGVTGRTSAPYDIPARLISKAMTREDGDTLVNKVRLQYDEEYQRDPEMKLMIDEVGTAMDRNFSPPPPRRSAAQPVLAQPGNGVGIQPSVKADPTTTATASTSGGPGQPKKTTKPKQPPAVIRQNFRKNHDVMIILEASPLDIVRTHRTQSGRQLWAAKGLIWPEQSVTSTDVSPESWAGMSVKLARYCPRNHFTGWLVLVAGDIGYCHECQHPNLIQVDIYLPSKSRFNILRRDYGINTDEQVFNANTDKLTDQPNHLFGLHSLSKGLREEGTLFRRSILPVPMEVQEAVSQGRINELYKKECKKTASVDSFLLSEKNVPKLNKRKLGSKIKNTLASYEKYAEKTFGARVDFHIQRLQHYWDLSDFTEKELKSTIPKMLKRIDDLYDSKHLTANKFNPDVHWFIRKDVAEMLHSKTLDSLLIELTGQTDPLSLPATLKPAFADADLADIDHTIGNDLDLTTPKRNTKVEKDADSDRRPRKRIKREDKAEDLVSSDLEDESEMFNFNLPCGAESSV